MAQKILIVDDDLYIRELYQEVLKGAGYEVDTVADGESGLEKIKSGLYELILLDVMMPKLDGLGVLSKLAEEKSPNFKMPVIILWTNLAHDPAIQEGLKKGAKAVIVKADMPTPDHIIQEVRKYLTASQPAR